MAKRILVICILLLSFQSVKATNFWQHVAHNLKEAVKGSRFECTKYETQKYQVEVRRNPSSFMPFTEMKPKAKKCVSWQHDRSNRGAVKSKCVKYQMVNYSESEHKRLYKTVTRKRTVCVEGHTIR